MLFVYVICTSSGPLKIGTSGNVPARLKALQASIPLRGLYVARTWKFRSPAIAQEIERRAHERLASQVICKEWFEVTLGQAVSVIDSTIKDLDAYKRDVEAPTSIRIEQAARRAGWDVVLLAYTRNGRNVSATARELKMYRRTVQRIVRRFH